MTNKNIKHKYVLWGSGRLLGPSWTFPDTFWTIHQKFNVLTKVVPKDLLRSPRHIPDDPNNIKNISDTCQQFGKFWVRAVDLTTRLPNPCARPAVRPPAVFSQQKKTDEQCNTIIY